MILGVKCKRNVWSSGRNTITIIGEELYYDDSNRNKDNCNIDDYDCNKDEEEDCNSHTYTGIMESRYDFI